MDKESISRRGAEAQSYTMKASKRDNRITITSNDGSHNGFYEVVRCFLTSSRGFNQFIDERFKKTYKCLVDCHHQFSKKTSTHDMLCFSEITSNGFNFSFGSSKNKMDGCCSFWGGGDDRNKDTSYLTKKRVELEVFRIQGLLESHGIEVVDRNEDNLTPVEKILYKESQNTHIHDGAKSLDDIKKYVEFVDPDGRRNHNYEYNSWDRDEKRILCGQIKYFYDYDGILRRGQVWHNINNMWWVLVDAEKDYKNISSREFFDYSNEPVRKKSSLPWAIKSLRKILDCCALNQDFEKCIIIRDKIQELEVANG